jgi:hypothetical protein
MSTLFRCPPSTCVKQDGLKIPEVSIVTTQIESAGRQFEHTRNSSATRGVSSFLLRNDHIVLLAIDALLVLHASFKKWRQRKRTIRALADLDERQLRDIGLTRDNNQHDDSFRLPVHYKGYRTLAELDDGGNPKLHGRLSSD